MNHPYYKDYGGRGIKFVFGSFADFLQAVGPRPSAEFTLDRIDNDGDYEAGNVRWATRTEQAANRRQHRRRIEQFSTEELLAELKRRGA